MNEYIVRVTGYPGRLEHEVVGELVRCKDCEFYEGENRYCFNDVKAKPDGYCSFAERKQDGKL